APQTKVALRSIRAVVRPGAASHAPSLSPGRMCCGPGHWPRTRLGSVATAAASGVRIGGVRSSGSSLKDREPYCDPRGVRRGTTSYIERLPTDGPEQPPSTHLQAIREHLRLDAAGIWQSPPDPCLEGP